ncbi:MAG: SUMF1/EgtB/PvdO family nonheme iron enzyme, partial [Caldilinea sp.]
TGISATNAVGCFPLGMGPHRSEEMSGNVWEWTSSQMKTYPYTPDDGRERMDGGIDVRRVLRGGSFYLDVRFVRCAARDGDNPNVLNGDLGFRVVLSPFPLDSESLCDPFVRNEAVR